MTSDRVSNERTVEALDNLRVHQRQLDAHGIEVGVSREALHEVIRAFGRLSFQHLRSPVTVSDADGKEWFERTFGVPLGDMPGRMDVERVNAGLCSIVMRPAALAPAEQAGDKEPVWGHGETVGNLIAQLRTLDPAMPIHAGFHAELRGTRQAMVRGLTLSRERVSGRKIDSGNEAVPYSAVIWASPQDTPTHPGGDSRVVAWMSKSGALYHPAHSDPNTDIALVPLSSLEAVERERDALRNESAKLIGQRDAALARIKQMQESNSRMAEGWSALITRAETAEASLAAAREALKQIAGVIPWQDSEMGFNDLTRAALAGSNGE